MSSQIIPDFFQSCMTFEFPDQMDLKVMDLIVLSMLFFFEEIRVEMGDGHLYKTNLTVPRP